MVNEGMKPRTSGAVKEMSPDVTPPSPLEF